MKIVELNEDNFDKNSLLDFKRFKRVNKKYYLKDKKKYLSDSNHIEDWNEEDRYSIAIDVLDHIKKDSVCLGTFIEEKIIAFIVIDFKMIGEKLDKNELVYFHVSQEERGKGIGKELFIRVKNLLKEKGISILYFAANPSFESQKFYEHIGAKIASELIDEVCSKNLEDIPMELII